MGRMYREGSVRAIGVCNFSPERLADLCLSQAAKPMDKPIELHPFYPQVGTLKVIRAYGVIPQARCPCRKRNRTTRWKNLRKKHGKTTAQVIHRWHYQRACQPLRKRP